MRLQLILAALVVCSTASAQPADDPAASATLRVYADDDHVVVVSPSAMVRASTAPRTVVTADTTVDAVTAASVDVMTSASPRAVEERRVELGLLVTQRIGSAPSWLGVGVRGSHENDYDAIRVRLGARRELALRNAALEATYVLGKDIARSASDADFRRTRASQELIVSVSQLLGPRTVADVIVDGTLADGYHASPYREVWLDQVGSPLALRLPEQTPRRRASLALAGMVRHAVGAAWSTSATYRGYLDDWSITSHTATGEVRRVLANRWLVGAVLRGYVQSAASFYRARYDGMPELRTHDRTLGAMRSAYASLTVDAPIDEAGTWHVIGALGVLRWWFLDFPAQRDRRGIVVHATVSTTW